MPCAYGFQFHNDLAIHKHIYPLGMFIVLAKHLALVNHRARYLPKNFMTSLRQFPGQRGLVGFFFQPTSEFGMNFYRCVYDLTGQIAENSFVFVHVVHLILQNSQQRKQLIGFHFTLVPSLRAADMNFEPLTVPFSYTPEAQTLPHSLLPSQQARNPRIAARTPSNILRFVSAIVRRK